MRSFYVYILTNASRTLYVGVTNDLVRRLSEHKSGTVPGFTKKYHVTQLVWFEETVNVAAAIAREKQIKGWVRAKKVALVSETNPTWRDLAADEGFFRVDTMSVRHPKLALRRLCRGLGYRSFGRRQGLSPTPFMRCGDAQDDIVRGCS